MMNRSEKTLPPESADWQRRLDHLVDGELAQGERRELLRQLEAAPDGWRQCAIAFLEAQAWREELAGLLGGTNPSPGQVPAEAAVAPVAQSRPAQRPNRLGRYVGTLLAMAASFLAALLLGSWLQEMRHTPIERGPKPDQFAGAVEEPGDVPRISVPPEEALAGGGPAAQFGPVPQDRLPESAEDWRMVKLAAGEGSNRESIRLPAVQRDRLDRQWLERLPRAVPREMLEALRRTGYQVRQRRELVPMRLHDGRQLVVPVEEVDVHYVGGPAL